MNVLSRFHAWRARRRHLRHLNWLRKERVVLTKPHHSTRRNGPEAVS